MSQILPQLWRELKVVLNITRQRRACFLSSYLVCNFQAPWSYKLQPKCPSTGRYKSVCFTQERAKSGLQVEGDRKSNVHGGAGAEAAPPLVPSAPWASCPSSTCRHKTQTRHRSHPKTPHTTGSHPHHNISFSRNCRAQVQENSNVIFMLFCTKSDSAEVQNTSFSMLCCEHQYLHTRSCSQVHFYKVSWSSPC